LKKLGKIIKTILTSKNNIHLTKEKLMIPVWFEKFNTYLLQYWKSP